MAGFLRILVYVLAAFCLYLAVLKALGFSVDLQWTGVKLLASGQNPYAVALGPYAAELIPPYQYPNYAQLLYLLKLPFSLFTFPQAALIFALINACFAIVSAVLVARLFALNYNQATLLFGCWFLSSPLRATIAAGQTSLLILVCLLMAASGIRPVLAISISYLKYSFAVPFGVALWRLLGFKHFLLSFIPVLFGLAVFLLLFRDVAVIWQPVLVASKYLGRGAGDFVELAFLIYPQLAGMSLFAVRCALALACGGLMWWSGRVLLEPSQVWIASGLLSLLFFTHLYYDYSLILIYFGWWVSRASKNLNWCLSFLPIFYAWWGFGRVYITFGREPAVLTLLLATIGMTISLLRLTDSHQGSILR